MKKMFIVFMDMLYKIVIIYCSLYRLLGRFASIFFFTFSDHILFVQYKTTTNILVHYEVLISLAMLKLLKTSTNVQTSLNLFSLYNLVQCKGVYRNKSRGGGKILTVNSKHFPYWIL